MRRIVLLGDVHDDEGRLDESLSLVCGKPTDLALLAGDLGEDPPWVEPARTDQREPHDASVKRVIERVRAELECPLVFVPGNHDLPDPPRDLPAVNADGRIVEVEGLSVAGLGGAGPQPFGFPYEWSDADADGVLQRIFGDQGNEVDVFLSHAPPARSKLDRTHRGLHVGSRAVDEWTGRIRPKLFVCGHIHEAWGVEWRHGVPCLNAGALGDPHGQEIAWTVEWEAAPARITCYRRGADGRPVVQSWP